MGSRGYAKTRAKKSKKWKIIREMAMILHILLFQNGDFTNFNTFFNWKSLLRARMATPKTRAKKVKYFHI